MFSRQAHISSSIVEEEVSQDTPVKGVRNAQKHLCKIWSFSLMSFFKASGFLDYEDRKRVRGEILRWVAERVDRGGGDLDTEREVLSVGGF